MKKNLLVLYRTFLNCLINILRLLSSFRPPSRNPDYRHLNCSWIPDSSLRIKLRRTGKSGLPAIAFGDGWDDVANDSLHIKSHKPAIITKLFLSLLLTLPLSASVPSPQDSLSFEVHQPARQHAKIKCLMLVDGTHREIDQIANLLKFDLEFSDQIDIDIKRSKEKLDASVLSKIYDQGTTLCVFVEELKAHKKRVAKKDTLALDVTIKDPATNTILFQKQFLCHPKTLVKDTHSIADELNISLTGEKGPMLSTLAYCKQKSFRHKVVCISDFACKTERTIVAAKTINVAPSWHSQAPLVFYSQFTRANSRLMSYDLHSKKHKVICSYDGLNMQPSFSPDGSKAVLCLSGGGNSELYLYDQAIFNKFKKRMYVKLTSNGGNNSSPCYLPNGNIVFCSDYQTGLPQIYILESSADKKTKGIRRLTNGHGYCAAPSYCPATNTIVYTRYLHGVFQLFTLNLDSEKPRERQLTFNHGDKVEPTWSGCGKYVAFTYGQRNPQTKHLTNQIATLNISSGNIRVLTTGNEQKSFPSWSGRSFYQL